MNHKRSSFEIYLLYKV